MFAYNLGRTSPKRRDLGGGDHKSVDRISELPDEVVVSIMSLLPLKEAAATSILSRRWLYLWMSTITLSEFDACNPMTNFYKLDPQVKEQRRLRYVKFLKVLLLRRVSVTGDILEYLLSNCQGLERLAVSFANRNLVSLRVVSPSIAFKYLSVKYCSALKRIEIRDADLSSFRYSGRALDLLVSNVPFLLDVFIRESPATKHEHWDKYHTRYECCFALIELPFTQLSRCLSQLEVLEMDINGAVYDDDYALPILPNLKHLKLIVKADYYWDLSLLTSFMKACPYLQRLMLKVNNICVLTRERLIQEVANCPHHYLKVVEIVGYRALPCIIQRVMFLIRSVLGLEKVIIDPVQSGGWRTAMDRGIVALKEEDEARQCAMGHLKREVPSTVDFVCL